MYTRCTFIELTPAKPTMDAMHNNLNSHQRKLFSLFTQAIYANPFSPDRRKTDCLISGLPESSTDKNILERVINLAAEQVRQLLQPGRVRPASFTLDTDRQLIQNLYLFHVFHTFSETLDKHILVQSREKDKLIPLPEADDALLSLKRLGFSQTESLHYFALFFQMRRAYFFIQRSIVGCSPAMTHLREQLWNNIFTHDIDRYARGLWQRMEDFSTLFLGETGTGKSLAAAAIGRSGFIPFNQKSLCFHDNFATAFVSRNLSQYSDQLIESELFGHKKGAFTGAIQSHLGVFALCSPYGAIFLDEIGDAPLTIQIKLLHVLQERTFSPVGSLEEKRFSGRVIAATNRPLNKMRSLGTFRNDFYFRLSSDKIQIPPLRVRIAEDPKELTLLIDFLLTRITGRQDDDLTETIQQTIINGMGFTYPWHGNVRELEQCIRQVILNNSCTRDTPLRQNTSANQLIENAIDSGTMNITELTARYCNLLHQKHGTYQAVARLTGLDRRTVKKHISIAEKHD
jgi:DNA-binding NtrC family response regulator